MSIFDGCVQDCLHLLDNLLRDNPANQLMFREAGFLANLHSLLRLPAPAAPKGTAFAAAVESQLAGSSAAAASVSADVCRNVCNAMQLTVSLLSPLSAAARDPAAAGGAEAAKAKIEMASMCLVANHAILAKTAARDNLVALALLLGQGPVSEVRCHALHTLCVMVQQRQQAQDALGNMTVDVASSKVPAIQVRTHAPASMVSCSGLGIVQVVRDLSWVTHLRSAGVVAQTADHDQ